MVSGQQPTIWGLGITFPVIAIIAVALRFQARRIKRQPLGADDWTILAALILGIGVTVDVLIMTQLGGLGTHAQYTKSGEPVDPHAIIIFGKTTYALDLLTWPAVGLTKISVLLFYKRIFSTPVFRRTVWVLICFDAAWTIAFTFALMFSCWPIESQWFFEIPFTCVNQKALFTTALATDVVTDGLILLLPVYKVWQLQMPLHRKLTVIFIFLLGGLVCVVGIIRIHFLTIIFAVLDSSPRADTQWLDSQAFYWTIIETNVGVLSACLPTLRPIQERYPFKAISSKVRSSMSNLLSSRSGSDDIRLRSMDTLDPEKHSRSLVRTQEISLDSVASEPRGHRLYSSSDKDNLFVSHTRRAS